MCEFKVLSKNGTGEKQIAEEIVSAKFEGHELVLRDVLGSTVKCENLVISEVDVEKESMILTELPFLPQLLSFIELYHACMNSKEYRIGIESKWNEVKASGDGLIRSIWKRYWKDQSE